MEAVVLFGGLGYIGRQILFDLKRRGYYVIVIDKRNVLFNIMRTIKFIQCDLKKNSDFTSIIELINQKQFDKIYCIHLAAYKSISESIEFPYRYYNNNVSSLLSALCISYAIRADKFIFSSSASVYKSFNDSEPFTELSIAEGSNPYSHSKLICEKIVEDTCISDKIKYYNLRYFNPIGSTPYTKDKSLDSLSTNLIKSQSDGEPFVIYGTDYDTPDGTCIRDFIDIRDLSAAHIHFIEKEIESGIYNVGTGKPISIKQLTEVLKDINDKIVIEHGNRRLGDDPVGYANVMRLNDTGFKCKYELKESIESLFEN